MEMIVAAKKRCELPLKPHNAPTQLFTRSYSKMMKTVPLEAALEEEAWAGITAVQAAAVADIRRKSVWMERRYWNRCRARLADGCLKFPASRCWRRFTSRKKKTFAINKVVDN